MNGTPFLSVQGLAKSYPASRGVTSPPVFEQVDFGIARGEFVCVIGHSGCGKTTILNILAGLEAASSGLVLMDGREIDGPGLERGVVFQGHALMPWLTVAGNIAFAVKSRWPRWSAAQVREQVQRFIGLVGLSGNEQRRPAELSGGMKQRVGIARAFAIQPKMLLLDEPFGALDALTRGVIQDELLKICAATRQTVFMITHDVDEAILLADRVLLMSTGPRARIAEVVVNPLPRDRTRQTLHHEPAFYPTRNQLVDFLVHRARGTGPTPRSKSMNRTDVTDKIYETKVKKGIKWADVAAKVGQSKEWVTAACLGQMTCDAAQAAVIAKIFGLTKEEALWLQVVPYKGSLPTVVPTDPLIYRWYEIVNVYGMTIKELIHEEFGDGIMSAIDFSMDITREPHPKGDRVNVVLSGKFLPYKTY